MLFTNRFKHSQIVLAAATVTIFSTYSCQSVQNQDNAFAPHPSNIIATVKGIENYKSDKKAVGALLSKLENNLDYIPTPDTSMILAPHYNATGINDAGVRKPFQEDARMVYDFALGYAVSGEKKYAEKAQHIIDAWSTTLKTLETKQADDIINFNLQYMIIAASLVKDSGNWDTANFDNFLKTVALPASTQANPNNHGLWGIFMEAIIYDWLGDREGMEKIRNRWIDHLSKSINADGIMENEIQRTATNNWRSGADKGVKGMAYTHYAMLPATLAAEIFAENNMPVWDTPSGKKLAKAFAQSASWTRHPETFPYYKSNNGKLEGLYSASYFYILNRIYGNADAQWLIQNKKIKSDGFDLGPLYH